MFEEEALHDGLTVFADVVLQQQAVQDKKYASCRLSLTYEKLALSIVSLHQQFAPRLLRTFAEFGVLFYFVEEFIGRCPQYEFHDFRSPLAPLALVATCPLAPQLTR